jgi:hypothetical protein
MISGGQLVDSVGGGISQIATTLYNAAFFAGLRLVAHTPHSFYISRYPMGREATISWGGPELVFDNNWPAPLRMQLTVRADKVAVRFYSRSLGRRVESWTGRPYAFPTTDEPGCPQPRPSGWHHPRRPGSRTCWLHDRLRAPRLPTPTPHPQRALARRLSARRPRH